MSRPKKHRHCECRSFGRAFKPSGIPMLELEQVLLQQDELESIRLCDLEGLAQDEAGQRMGVSRGTVQRLLARARNKVALAVVEGKALVLTENEPV